ncbi:MAG: hypothetical protein WB646_20320 [Steroidobacteraceae bacterium]
MIDKGLRALWERVALAAALCMFALFAVQTVRAGPVCEAAEHGMKADASDNTAAFVKTLAECAGETIHIAGGTYAFRPTGYAVGFRIPAATTLLGDGSTAQSATVLQVAASGNYQGFLWIRNVSNVSVRSIRFEGSPYDSGCSRNLDYGHAIYIQSDAGESAPVAGVDISDNLFRNFNGTSWVTFNAAPGSPGIGVDGQITVSGNDFDSDADIAGSCAAKIGMTYTADMVALHGSDLSANGLVANVTIDSNTFNAGYVRGAIAIWSGTKHIDIVHNSIQGAGLRLPMYPDTELGRYAILVYNSAHERPGLHPDGVRIVENTIANPVSCGIYVAVGRNLEIRGNRISGQTDRFDGTLPKGAISLNHADSVLALEGNVLSNNYIAISSVGSNVRMGVNEISVPPGGRSERIRP